MIDLDIDILKNFIGMKPPPISVLNAFNSLLRTSLPKDYLDFFTLYNGGEGFIGNEYLIIWPIEDILNFNHEYEVDKYAKDFLFFGSSGGGEGYAFDCRSEELTVVQIPFVGMSPEYANVIANTFSDFFRILHLKHG